MNNYRQPETNVLQVMNNSIICASDAPVPVQYAPQGQLGTMKVNEVNSFKK